MLPVQTSAASLAKRLTRPQRLGIFGHRGVGKTTLLTMLYREAVGGRLPGFRLAAADARTAEYFADKILQLEAGLPLPATLAETELRLHLYRGPVRIELVVRDYQGEHLELGREEAIHGFLRDCDAVWFCFDAAAVPDVAALRRRQHEVEQLFEHYLAAESATTMTRPCALLLTKADLLGTGDDPGWSEHLEMTRHALQTHCPNSGAFAVSSLGDDARIAETWHPAEAETRRHTEADTEIMEAPPRLATPSRRFTPHNLTELLDWLTSALQSQDEARLEKLWSLAPGQAALLGQGVACFTGRYPGASATTRFQQKLSELRRRQLRRNGLIGTAAAACLLAALGAYDALGYHKVRLAETHHADDPATALHVWENYQDWHPTRNLLQPDSELREKKRLAELEKEARQRACAKRLEELRRLAADPDADVDSLVTQLRAFHDGYPEVSPADWGPLRAAVQARQEELQARRARTAFDQLVRQEEERSADLVALVTRADQFLQAFAGSAHESEVRRRRATYVRRLDERDIETARAYSRRHPFNFQTRREHYQRYLDQHPGNGAFAREAEEALQAVAVAWDKYDFRAVRDHFEQRPGDIPNLVARCRSYLAAHPSGSFTRPAGELLRWSERVTTTGEYRVAVRGGSFESRTARFFSRGPDLSVALEVRGIRYGPSTISVNRYEPEWNYEFPRLVRWKLGDPVRIIVTDHDWNDRVVVDIESDDDDPLAMRLLTGEVFSGNNTVTFESNFAMPVLPRIE